MPKPPTNTLFLVVRTVGGDLGWLLAEGGEKMRYLFSTIAPPRGVPSKYCYISSLTYQHQVLLTSRVTTKMLSYYYSIEYLGRILVLVLF